MEYTLEQIKLENMLQQFHSMMIEFIHAGKELRYEDICKEIGYTPLEGNDGMECTH